MVLERSDLADRWLRAVPTLQDIAVRSAYARSELGAHDVALVAPALERVLELAAEDDERAREVLPTLVLSLCAPAFAGLRSELSIVARSVPLPHLSRLFPLHLEPEASEEPPPPIPKNPAGRTLTLGERKALARRPSRASLEKLLFDQHPAVLDIVLNNPRVTEDDVVRIAARRPGSPVLLSLVAQHQGWMQRARVRLTLVQHPRTPLDLSVPLVLLLVRQELEQVVIAVDLPEPVRTLAAARLERIPPFHVPALEAGG